MSRHFPKETNIQQVHEKVLSITNHQGSTNQNHKEKSSFRVAVIKKTRGKCWQGCGEKRTLVHTYWELNWCSYNGNSMEVPQKLKIELPCDPAILLLGVYSKEMKTGSSAGAWTPMFTAALFSIAETGEWPKGPSVDDWIKQIWYLYLYIYIYKIYR